MLLKRRDTKTQRMIRTQNTRIIRKTFVCLVHFVYGKNKPQIFGILGIFITSVSEIIPLICCICVLRKTLRLCVSAFYYNRAHINIIAAMRMFTAAIFTCFIVINFQFYSLKLIKLKQVNFQFSTFHFQLALISIRIILLPVP